MKKFTLPLVAILGVMFAANCSTMELKSPSVQKRVVLGADSKQCKTVKSTGKWFLLFGLIPLSKKKSRIEFSDTSKTYQIRERVKALDVAVTLLGGWAVTLTRKTIEVRACDEDFLVTTKAAVQKQKQELVDSYENRMKEDVSLALNKYTLSASRKSSREPIVVMKDGTSHQGLIIEISEATVVISVTEQKEETEPGFEGRDPSKVEPVSLVKPAKPVKPKYIDKVIMKNGKVLLGKITFQTAKAISIEVKGKSITIRKPQIKRIAYQIEVKAKPEPKPVVIPRVHKTLPRLDIRKIIFRK